MAEPPSQRITPVILCGGAGTRLWPLSRVDRPKPFVSLNGDESLLQETARRVGEGKRFGPPVVVAAEEYGDAVASELGQAGISGASLILEPVPRGTAPAIAMAAFNSDRPDDLMLVLPSDHVVKDPAAFEAAVAAGAEAARQGWLVTFGIRPDRPETGYGYIQQGGEVGSGVFRAERFVEKPDATTAARYVAEGRFLWNSGIFLFTSRLFLAELGEHAPYILDEIRAASPGRREADRLYPDPSAFARSPAQSVDHAVMEKSARVAVVPVDMGWSDIGSWEAMHAIADKDAEANALTGDVVMIDSEGSLVRSEGPLVVGVGIRDMVVVATERSVLVVPRGQSQRVREAVDVLIKRGHTPPPELNRGDD